METEQVSEEPQAESEGYESSSENKSNNVIETSPASPNEAQGVFDVEHWYKAAVDINFKILNQL